MQPINQIALKVLAENPQGLDRHELADKVGQVLGKPIKEASLKLGDLGLSGQVRSHKEPRQVLVTREVDVYFATTLPATPEPAPSPEPHLDMPIHS